MTAYNYLISSGWWCDESSHGEDRTNRFGDQQIRGRDFHQLWYRCIKRFTNPGAIYIVDSASPTTPILHEDEIFVHLQKNFGHSTNCTERLGGFVRAVSLGMYYAYINDFEYWVYIEQDALVFGDGLVERCIDFMRQYRCPILFGDGRGTPQPIQQSFMLMHKDAIMPFLYGIDRIRASDREISPEWKYSIAANSLLRLIPEGIFRGILSPSKHGRIIRSITRRLMSAAATIGKKYRYLPIGYGRARPIQFNDSHFYFQHGTREELDRFMEKLDAANG
ncbi:MAG: hypothetical protein B6D68_03540 [spirochete symbiont of Stewartia floridana]|nr:MAG: hypothetical protein B6D68_03540 [spirochete symbiont of Stewartia floridana]